MAITLPRSQRASPSFIPQSYQNVSIDPAAYDQGGITLKAMGGMLDEVADQASKIANKQKSDERAQQSLIEQEQNKALIRAVLDREKSARIAMVGDVSTAGSSPTDAAGPQGYLNKEGQQAVDEHDSVVQKLAQDEQVIRAKIPTEKGRKRFDTAVKAVGEPIKDLMQQHLAKQRVKAFQQAAEAAAEESSKTYVAFSDNEKIAKIAWESGKAEAIRAAVMNSDPAVTPEKNLAKWQSQTHRSVIERDLDRGDLTKAEIYLKTNAHELERDDLRTAQNKVGRARDHAIADKALMPLRNRLKQRDNPLLGKTEPRSGGPTSTAHDGPEHGGRGRGPLSAVPSSYPYGKDSQDGLPTPEALQQEFEQTADHSELTETQRDYGWAAVRRDYALAKQKARQQRQEDLTQAMELIDNGASLNTLPLELQERLSEQDRQGVERYFVRHIGFAPDETDWDALGAIAGDSDHAFSERILAQDRPFLSNRMSQTLGHIQTLMQSNDLQQRNQGLRLMRGLRLSVEALGTLPSGLRTSARMEMMVGESLRLVQQAIESGQTLRPADIKKHMALYLHEARLEQAWGR